MDRTYQLRLHRDDRPGAFYEAELYRVTSDGGLDLVAEVVPDDHEASDIIDLFRYLGAELSVDENELGELP